MSSSSSNGLDESVLRALEVTINHLEISISRRKKLIKEEEDLIWSERECLFQSQATYNNLQLKIMNQSPRVIPSFKQARSDHRDSDGRRGNQQSEASHADDRNARQFTMVYHQSGSNKPHGSGSSLQPQSSRHQGSSSNQGSSSHQASSSFDRDGERRRSAAEEYRPFVAHQQNDDRSASSRNQSSLSRDSTKRGDTSRNDK